MKTPAFKAIAPYVLALTLPCASLCTLAGVANAKSVTENWYVAGVHNGADVRHVRDALKHLPGVTYLGVSQATLEIRFDNQKLSDRQLEAAVAHAGAHPGEFRLTQKVDNSN